MRRSASVSSHERLRTHAMIEVPASARAAAFQSLTFTVLPDVTRVSLAWPVHLSSVLGNTNAAHPRSLVMRLVDVLRALPIATAIMLGGCASDDSDPGSDSSNMTAQAS